MFSISYINFWDSFDPENNWFTNFLKHHFGKLKVVSSKVYSDILISSCHGPISNVIESNSAVKVFCCDENLLRLKNYRDKNILEKTFNFQIDSLGDLESSSKRIYFPMWIKNYSYYSFVKGNNVATYIVKQRKRNLSKKKEIIASLVASHDANGVRRRLSSSFDKHGKVCAPGFFMKNTNEIGGDIDSKIDFISKSLFNICPENSYIHGYRSEKLIQALEAGTIPVYWGWKPENDYINKSCYIFHDCSSIGDKLVDDAIKKPLEYLTVPIFNDWIDDYLEEKYLLLKRSFLYFLEKVN